MAVTAEDVKVAESEFLARPTQNTAAMFLSKLREAEEHDAIGDDEFLDGLASIEAYLWKGGTVVQVQVVKQDNT